jgi:anti-sigma factor RsiW
VSQECRKLEETFLHAYVDGEFSGEENAEVQQHLVDCAICLRAVRLHRSYKAAMLRANQAAPHAVHDALKDAIAAQAVQGRWARAFQRPSTIATAAACVGAAVWFAMGGLSHPLFQSPAHSLIDDGVQLHAGALPLDFAATDPGSAQQWLQRKLEIGVRVPRFAQGARLQGVRLSNVHQHRGAVVTYSLPQGEGRRVSLLIVDDPEPQLPGAARRVADREVWLSRAKGFNIASWRNDEIVYSLISDLDEQDVLALVQSADLR